MEIFKKLYGYSVIRYALVGMATNAVGYFAYLLVTALGISPHISMTGLYILGATLGFFGNRRITFAHKGNIASSGLRFCMAHGLGYLLNLFLLSYFAYHLGYDHRIIQAIAIVMVAGMLFVLFKFFVFPPKTGDEAAP